VLVALWRRSWLAQGWTPRILIGPKNPRKGWYHCPVTRMNLSWRATKTRRPGDLMDFPRSADGETVTQSMRKELNARI